MAGQRKSRLQFVFDLAHATFSQPGLPTSAQIDALRRTLSECAAAAAATRSLAFAAATLC